MIFQARSVYLPVRYGKICVIGYPNKVKLSGSQEEPAGGNGKYTCRTFRCPDNNNRLYIFENHGLVIATQIPSCYIISFDGRVFEIRCKSNIKNTK